VKYMLSIFVDESAFAGRTPEQMQENMRRWDAYTKQAIEAGVHLGGEGLAPSETATTVRFEAGGEQFVSDGPFAETKEQLGGYYLLDCKDRDDALAWAKKLPMAGGSVEVRPVMDYEAAGSQVHSPEAEAAR
jgi:hypothetical protein